ncbi:MAG: S26 family signal peptidase [Nevskiales bacterium]
MLVALVSWTMDHLVVVRGDSIRYRLVWVAGGEVHKGDYVNLRVSHPIISADGQETLLTKRVDCIAGETLRFDGKQFWCRDILLGGVIAKTWDGKPLTPFAWDGPIPDGKVFVMGEHPRSFDSRYFGLVDLQRLTRVWGLL